MRHGPPLAAHRLGGSLVVRISQRRANAPERPIRSRDNPAKQSLHQRRRAGASFPGSFSVECVSLREYIRGAYGSYGFGRNPHVRPPKVLGGPDWVDTDHYDIVAKAPADTPLDEMYGPMMRALLEDRFGLKIHSEIREPPGICAHRRARRCQTDSLEARELCCYRCEVCVEGSAGVELLRMIRDEARFRVGRRREGNNRG